MEAATFKEKNQLTVECAQALSVVNLARMATAGGVELILICN